MAFMFQLLTGHISKAGIYICILIINVSKENMDWLQVGSNLLHPDDNNNTCHLCCTVVCFGYLRNG